MCVYQLFVTVFNTCISLYLCSDTHKHEYNVLVNWHAHVCVLIIMLLCVYLCLY